MENFKAVLDYNNLVKDMNSRAIINIDDREFSEFLQKSEKIKKEKNEIFVLNQKIKNLEDRIEKILKILEEK